MLHIKKRTGILTFSCNSFTLSDVFPFLVVENNNSKRKPMLYHRQVTNWPCSICRFAASTFTAHQLIKFQKGLPWGARIQIEIKAACGHMDLQKDHGNRNPGNTKVFRCNCGRKWCPPWKLYVCMSCHCLTPGLVVCCWLRICRPPPVRPIPHLARLFPICKKLTGNAHKILHL